MKTGRPRTERYIPIDEFVMRWKDFESKFNNIHKQYQLYYIIAYSFDYVVHPIVRKVGTRRKLWTDDERNNSAPIWRTVATGAFRDEKTGEIDSGDSVVIDLDHDPPRLRILLNNGKRKEAPLRCPWCPKTKGLVGRKGWKDQDVLFIEETRPNFKTVDSFDYRMCCFGNHVNWRIEDVKRYLHNLGLV